MSARTVALFAALTALLAGRDYKGAIDTSPEPRRLDEGERQRRRVSRTERGARRYERWRRSGGKA